MQTSKTFVFGKIQKNIYMPRIFFLCQHLFSHTILTLHLCSNIIFQMCLTVISGVIIKINLIKKLGLFVRSR